MHKCGYKGGFIIVAQNQMRKLLPLFFCLIMVLSTAIGTDGSARADEIMDSAAGTSLIEKSDIDNPSLFNKKQPDIDNSSLFNEEESDIDSLPPFNNTELLKAHALGQPAENTFEQTKNTARTAIEEAIAVGTASSASVAIMDEGELVYAEGFSMADREKSIPVDKNTVFNIGSISKMFVATSIMLLVDEGKVALDNPVTNYLPEFTMADERYQDITVRMLLNHSSGLPGSTFWNNFGFEYNQNIYSELLESLSLSTLKHRPGELAAYCNDGFTLAEMIVVRVTGQSYGDFLTERIFEPLAMNHTALGVGRLPAGMNPARFYRPDGKAEPLEIVSLLASGGLSSTPEDLCRFAASFSDLSAILSAQSQTEMLQRQQSELQGKLRGDSWPFGLGWDYADITAFSDESLRLYGKSGGTGHYASMLYTIPSKQISVAVIASGPQCDSSGIALKILSAYLKEKDLITTKEEAKEPVEAQPIPSELMVYEGYYCINGDPYQIAFDAEQGQLTFYAVDGSNELALFTAVYNDGFFYDGENMFYFTNVDGTSYFVQDNPNFNFHMVAAEKFRPLTDPLELSISMDGRVWLRRNVKATEATMLLPTHIVSSSQIPALPGYVNFFGMKSINSPDYAGLPVKSMRDLTELRLVEQKGAVWVWLSGADYMPIELAPLLNPGDNTLTIGNEGYNEWRAVGFDATLGFDVPAQGRVIVFGAEGILYDSLVDRGDIFVPAGCLLEVAGNPGALFQVTASATETMVPVVGISLNKDNTSIQMGYYEILTAVVDPANATNVGQLTWNSSNERVAAVDSSGKVQAIAPGKAEITAEADGIKSPACVVTVFDGSSNSPGGGESTTTPPENPAPVIPETDTSGADQFTDIAYYSWAREAISALMEKDIFIGVSGTSFAPANPVNRADYIYLIVRWLGLTAEVEGNFEDIAEDEYYYKEIAIAKALGLTTGIDGINFHPEAGITREDMFVLAYRVLLQQGLVETEGDISVLEQFIDSAGVSPYAQTALATLISMDLIKGSENMINPGGYATRAEMAVFIHRLASRF